MGSKTSTRQKSDAHKAARRRMSYVTPENCAKVLSKSAYWTPEFLDLYLDRCDEEGFHRPKEGYLLSRQAPELAARVRVGEDPGEFRTEADKLSARVIALAVAGSCARSFGNIVEAELSLKWARDLAENARLTARAACELVRRTAALKVAVAEDDAEAWVERAVAMADQFDDQPNLADALVLQGGFLAVAGRGGVDQLARGVACVDLKSSRGQRTFDAAVYNMAFGAVRSGNLAETALWLGRAKKRLARLPTSIKKARVIWLEGYFSGELGATRYGIRQLEKMRSKILGFGSLVDYVLCSIDLLDLHLSEGNEDEIESLIAGTMKACEEIGDGTPHDLKETLNRYIRSAAGLPERSAFKVAIAEDLQTRLKG